MNKTKEKETNKVINTLRKTKTAVILGKIVPIVFFIYIKYDNYRHFYVYDNCRTIFVVLGYLIILLHLPIMLILGILFFLSAVIEVVFVRVFKVFKNKTR